MVGASGAISGVIGAYLMLHPNVRVWVLMLFRIPLRLSAGFALGVWILLNVVYAVIAYVQNNPGGTAWWAHVAGFLAGVTLIIFMRQPNVPLFDKGTGLEDDVGDKGKWQT
jgi:membrane associated rhomboid family serine protease